MNYLVMEYGNPLRLTTLPKVAFTISFFLFFLTCLFFNFTPCLALLFIVCSDQSQLQLFGQLFIHFSGLWIC